MKKIISVAILVVLILSSCSLPNKQQTDSQSSSDAECISNGFVYEITDNTVKILQNQNKGSQIIIPEEIDGKAVTTVGSDAFYQQREIASVVFPQNLKTIEGAAFYRCYSLTHLVIPKNVELIEAEAFFRCSSLLKITVDPNNQKYSDINGVLFDKAQTELLHYPEGNPAESYTVPTTVKKIADSAFGYRCQYLKELTIPSSVVEFPEYNIFIYPDDIVLKVEKDSAAEAYAKKHDLNFIHF